MEIIFLLFGAVGIALLCIMNWDEDGAKSYFFGSIIVIIVILVLIGTGVIT